MLLPYNYLLDPTVRAANKIRLAHAYVIFDEAHNLLQFCEQSASAAISARDVAGAIAETRKVLELINVRTEHVRTAMDTTTSAFGTVDFDEDTPSHGIDEHQLTHLLCESSCIPVN